ncbi:UNVERIFIED_CONTAM: Dap3 [Trichonephila clavipes]
MIYSWLSTHKSYTWSKREITEEGAPLMDIVEHGVQRVRHSSDCIGALLREIKLHSQSGKFKVMVIVDGVNAFWNQTNVKRPDKSLVPSQEITPAHAFMKLLQNDWGFEHLDPFIPIETENYTEKEINSVLDYYCDRLWIQSERAQQEGGRKQIKFLSGYNPYEVMKVCDPL